MSNSEQSISFKDLLFIILSAWRQIILFAVIGALLMAGFLALRHWRSSLDLIHESEVSLTSKEMETATTELLDTDLELLSLKKIKTNLMNKAALLQDRIRNSVYLSIDENAQPIKTLTVRVDPEEPGPDAEDSWEQRRYATILDFYRVAKSEEFRQYLVEANDSTIGADWMAELVDSQLLEESYLQVSLTAADAETVVRLAEAADTFFQRDVREQTDVLFLYDIQVSAQPLEIIRNPQIEEKRIRLNEEWEAMRLSIKQIEDDMARVLEAGLESKRLEKVEKLMSDLKGQSVSRLTLAKYSLVGALAGIMLAFIFAVYRAMSKAVIRSGEWLARQEDLLYLGSLPELDGKKEKRALGSAIDRWLENRFYVKGDRAITPSERMKYLDSVIHGLWSSLAGWSETTGDDAIIAFVSDEAASATDEFIHFINAQREMADQAESASFKAVRIKTDTIEGIERLGKARAAVLVISNRKSRQDQVFQDLALMDRMGIPFLGLLTVEGGCSSETTPVPDC